MSPLNSSMPANAAVSSSCMTIWVLVPQEHVWWNLNTLDERHQRMNVMLVTGGSGGFDFLKCETITLASVYQTSYMISPVMTEGQRKKMNQGKQCWYSWHPLLLESLSLHSFATLGVSLHDLYLFNKPQQTTLPQIYSVFQHVYIFHIHTTRRQEGPKLDPVLHGAAPLLYFTFAPINFSAKCFPASLKNLGVAKPLSHW